MFLYCITKKDLQHLASPETFPCPITNHPASRCHSSCYYRHVFHMNRCGQTEMIKLNNLWYPSSLRVPHTFARLQLSIENMWWPLRPLAAGSLMAEEANWEVTGSNCRWNTCELERWCLVLVSSCCPLQWPLSFHQQHQHSWMGGVLISRKKYLKVHPVCKIFARFMIFRLVKG